MPGSSAAGPAGSACGSHRSGSPVPFALFGRLGSEGEGVPDGSPATSAAAASPDVFSSPFLAASDTTLTVDYRALHSDLHGGWRQQVGAALRRWCLWQFCPAHMVGFGGRNSCLQARSQAHHT